MHKKAQTGSMDVVIALAIFVVALALLFMVLRTQQANVDAGVRQRDLAWKANAVADLLVTHRGVPGGWERNASSVTIIGLAASDHVLSAAKVSAFLNLSAETVRDAWNIQPADYYLELTYLNGSVIGSAGNTSAYDSGAAVERIVVYNNETATMRLRLQH
ncbi:MAG: hypothetical protein AABY13_03400 [Nanoarchaeota archaeon]